MNVDPYTSDLGLDVRVTTMILDAYATTTLVVDAHTTDLGLDTHAPALVLDATGDTLVLETI
jgi:hypothetical protein